MGMDSIQSSSSRVGNGEMILLESENQLVVDLGGIHAKETQVSPRVLETPLGRKGIVVGLEVG